MYLGPPPSFTGKGRVPRHYGPASARSFPCPSGCNWFISTALGVRLSTASGAGVPGAARGPPAGSAVTPRGLFRGTVIRHHPDTLDALHALTSAAGLDL